MTMCHDGIIGLTPGLTSRERKTMITETTTNERSRGADGSAIQRVQVEDIASDWTELYVKMAKGDLPLPCWLEIGNACHKITAETHTHIARGMILCLEAREAFQ